MKVNAIKDIIDKEMSNGQFIYEVFRITSDENQLKKIKISHGFSSILLKHFGYNVEDIQSRVLKQGIHVLFNN